MIFPNGKKKAGFFENNVFVLPLKDDEALKPLLNEEDIPEEFITEFMECLQERKLRQKEDGGTSEQYFSSEVEIMGT